MVVAHAPRHILYPCTNHFPPPKVHTRQISHRPPHARRDLRRIQFQKRVGNQFQLMAQHVSPRRMPGQVKVRMLRKIDRRLQVPEHTTPHRHTQLVLPDQLVLDRKRNRPWVARLAIWREVYKGDGSICHLCRRPPLPVQPITPTVQMIRTYRRERESQTRRQARASE